MQNAGSRSFLGVSFSYVNRFSKLLWHLLRPLECDMKKRQFPKDGVRRVYLDIFKAAYCDLLIFSRLHSLDRHKAVCQNIIQLKE